MRTVFQNCRGVPFKGPGSLGGSRLKGPSKDRGVQGGRGEGGKVNLPPYRCSIHADGSANFCPLKRPCGTTFRLKIQSWAALRAAQQTATRSKLNARPTGMAWRSAASWPLRRRAPSASSVSRRSTAGTSGQQTGPTRTRTVSSARRVSRASRATEAREQPTESFQRAYANIMRQSKRHSMRHSSRAASASPRNRAASFSHAI